MHRDQKIGLSLAVLLVGFAAAFCFRHQPLTEVHPLALEQAAALDSRIEQLSVRAYTQLEGVEIAGPPPIPIDPVSEIVDVSFVDQPVGEMATDDSPEGDIIAVYAGPPEPLPTAPNDAVPAALVMAAVSAAITTPSGSATAAPPDVAPKVARTTSQPVGDGVPAETPSRNYIVKTGDTLSGVSLNVYGTISRYLEIFQANRDVLSDPDDLPVGTLLRIP